MKTQLRNNFVGFKRVSMFPYVWIRGLIYLTLITGSVASVYYFGPFVDLRMKITACFVTLFIMGMLVIIIQHRFATFACRHCGNRMQKYRDPDTTDVTFYYVCEECRIYWKNSAVIGYP